MTRFLTVSFCLMMMLLSTIASADEEKSEKELKKIAKEQKGIREMRSEVLKDLYKDKAGSKQEVEDSVAVAAFSSLGINLFLFSTARGGGIVRETKTGEETFMRMFSLGGGFGMGVKDFRVVFIFHTQAAFDNFLSAGWDFAAQTDAAAKAGEEGDTAEAAGTIVDGVSLYQFTENGLALQATLQGTKYYKDKDLN
jgi:lipid-binding SYLF domain-containing protein